MAKILKNKEEFEAEVMKSDLPVLVDFYADWCGPCKMIAPVLEEIGNEFDGKAKIVKVNVDESPDLAGAYDVRSIPTLVFFKDGKAEDKVIGVVPKEQLVQKFNNLV